MIREKVITDEDLSTLWEAGKNDAGKVKGPVTMIAKLFKPWEYEATTVKPGKSKGNSGTGSTMQTPLQPSHNKLRYTYGNT